MTTTNPNGPIALDIRMSIAASRELRHIAIEHHSTLRSIVMRTFGQSLLQTLAADPQTIRIEASSGMGRPLFAISANQGVDGESSDRLLVAIGMVGEDDPKTMVDDFHQWLVTDKQDYSHACQ